MKLVNSNLSPLMAFGNLCPALNFYCFDLCSVLPMESTKGKGMYNGEPMPSTCLKRNKIQTRPYPLVYSLDRRKGRRQALPPPIPAALFLSGGRDGVGEGGGRGTRRADCIG